MRNLLEQNQLWGYLPLVLLFWLGIGGLSATLALSETWRKESKYFLLALCIGIALGFAFTPINFLPLVFIAWMVLYHQIHRQQSNKLLFFQSFISFYFWNVITTYWVANTAFAAGIVAIVANALLMTACVMLFKWLGRKLPGVHQFLVFAAIWISFEFLHFHWEIQWPWLTLGHYYAHFPSFFQWYEWTGVLGGSLQILGIAYLLFAAWIGNRPKTAIGAALIIFILPVMLGLWFGKQEDGASEKIKVAVIQPNFEPHFEKQMLSNERMLPRVMFYMDEATKNDPDIDFIVLPETSFSMPLHNWRDQAVTQAFMRFLERNPHMTIIVGLNAYEVLPPRAKHTEYTRTSLRSNGDTVFWESSNIAASLVANGEAEIYYKSKLVPGAEIFPFKKLLFFIKPLVDKLGGSVHGLKTQKERTVLSKEYPVAPVICYESVFGAYDSGYSKHGAQWMAIMTNDGWWDNTAGHKQHLEFASFRAVEQYRSIARAANSGTSAFIDTDGNIQLRTAYDEAAYLTSTITLHTELTWYAQYGDVLGRIAIVFLGIFLLMYAVSLLK